MTKRPYRISPSPIHGKGVFAKRNIPAGTILPDPVSSYLSTRRAGFGGFNHSCAHNIKLATTIGIIIALRDIKRGEELTLDYGYGIIGDPRYCNCPVCRKKK